MTFYTQYCEIFPSLSLLKSGKLWFEDLIFIYDSDAVMYIICSFCQASLFLTVKAWYPMQANSTSWMDCWPNWRRADTEFLFTVRWQEWLICWKNTCLTGKWTFTVSCIKIVTSRLSFINYASNIKQPTKDGRLGHVN